MRRAQAASESSSTRACSSARQRAGSSRSGGEREPLGKTEPRAHAGGRGGSGAYVSTMTEGGGEVKVNDFSGSAVRMVDLIAAFSPERMSTHQAAAAGNHDKAARLYRDATSWYRTGTLEPSGVTDDDRKGFQSTGNHAYILIRIHAMKLENSRDWRGKNSGKQ